MPKQQSSRWYQIDRFIPWLIFFILASQTYAKFFLAPYAGFQFSADKIGDIFVQSTEGNSLEIGDRIIRIGPVVWQQYLVDLRQMVFDELIPGQIVPVVVDRNGQTQNIDWTFPGPTQDEVFERLNGLWWMAYVFWFAGTGTLLFIRPKETSQRMMAAFFYLTAIWLAAGSGPSAWHVGYSALILTSTIWLCIPIYLQFHWLFPKPLGRLPTDVWIILHLAGSILAVLQWFQILPARAYLTGFFLALAGSVILLAVHFIRQPEQRHDIRLLTVAVGLILIPSIGMDLLLAIGVHIPLYLQGGAFLSLPALPGAYFLIAYRQQFQELRPRIDRLTRIFLLWVGLGTLSVILLAVANFKGVLLDSTLFSGTVAILITSISAFIGFAPFLALPAMTETVYSFGSAGGGLELRANRLLSLYLFPVLVGILLSIVIISLDNMVTFPGETFALAMVVSLLAGVLTAIGFPPFQRYVDRKILGIKLLPDELQKHFSDRISTSLDQHNLIDLLQGEFLPSLLIRQSILLRSNTNGVETLIQLGIDRDQVPTSSDFPTLLALSGRILLSSKRELKPYPWVRLILPLKVGGEVLGLWLFGRRDPDDFYGPSEISLLEILANQTAIALANIDQAARLHTLYQSNIDWHEEERKALARELHDEVLGQMAALSMHTSSLESPEFFERFSHVTDSIRHMISTLRPAMLEYGLWSALDEMVDGLSDRIQGHTTIGLEVGESDVRYDTKVEEHTYRIAQQACENALSHAGAQHIRIRGKIEPARLELIVEDDGIGIPIEQLDFSSLLGDRHFGLAGMHERADLIGADLRIKSEPDRGTRVAIRWSAKPSKPG